MATLSDAICDASCNGTFSSTTQPTRISDVPRRLTKPQLSSLMSLMSTIKNMYKQQLNKGLARPLFLLLFSIPHTNFPQAPLMTLLLLLLQH
ncbi:hypothetical protein LSM04_002409 [Trypanosoma melophagium]|uniref:uncharacterized protein n=1 Tax=Trypanosoma melophagium TaxID=715481 RepID=UPI003519F711|nr:hypothetical protein LSM04_002409 [Trypanosoma melophagium]